MVLNHNGLTEGLRETLVKVQERDGVHPEVRDWRPVVDAVEFGHAATALVFGEGDYPQPPTPAQLARMALQ